jgi:hypothetical protein
MTAHVHRSFASLKMTAIFILNVRFDPAVGKSPYGPRLS